MNFILATLLFVPSFSLGQAPSDTTQAHQYYQDGDSLFDARQYQNAIVQMEQALALFSEAEVWRRSIDAEIIIIESLWRSSNFEEAIARADKLSGSIESQLGPNSKQEGFLNFAIGNIKFMTGDFEAAIEGYDKSINILKSRLGDEHKDLLKVYYNQANLYYYSGDHDKALAIFEKLVAIRIKLNGEQDPEIAGDYLGIGSIYRIKGYFEEALVYFEKGLAIELNAFGKDHFGLADWYGSIGLIYTKYGSYQKAFDYYSESLRLQKALYQGQPNLAYTSNYINMGAAMYYQDELDSALFFYNKAVDLFESLQEGTNYNLLPLYNNIAQVLVKQGLYTEAISNFKKSLTTQRAIQEDILTETGQSHSGLALSYTLLDDFDSAQYHFERAVRAYNKLFGQKHALLAQTYREHGHLYLKKQQKDKALHFFQKSILSVLPDIDENLSADWQYNPSSKASISSYQLLTSYFDKATAIKSLSDEQKEDHYLDLAFQTYQVCDTLIDELQDIQIDFEDKINFRSLISGTYGQLVNCAYELYTTSGDRKFLEMSFYYSEKSKASIMKNNMIDFNSRSFANIPDSIIQ
ncbi:MAG: tetratricopeptide repeat protein, partial [Bacteroidota bacterium]